MPGNILFSESQKFNQWHLWLLLIASNLVLFFLLYKAFSVRRFVLLRGTTIVLMVVTLGTVVLTILTFMMRLDTEISTEGVYVRFYPIHRQFRFYSWDSIAEARVREYGPISEYGGWGLKGHGDNKALNVSGDEGLQLVFTNKKRLLIGTQKKEELEVALHKAHR